MIDFVVVRSAQCHHCLDVQVLCGATFWTDHKLVRVTLRLALSGSRGRLDRRVLSIAVWKLIDASICEDYCRELSDQLEGVGFDDACGAEAGWNSFRIVW